ncbi:hypothetical protein ACFVVM_28425 [Nocardia sp. NPDC058176]|uniref:DUF7373 family lipoprotein n=1 Tax=Nocardia sp. NPDC058176 TaxID=3346368 RepID=UPI0036D8D19C
MTTVLTACGATLSGTAQPGETDISALDVGSYPTKPLNAHDEDPVPGLHSMHVVAAMRIADHVINSGDIDPQMKFGQRAGTYAGTTMPRALSIGTEIPAIAEKHKLLYGFESSGASQNNSLITYTKWPIKDDTNELTASTMVFQFPTTEQATAAAQEFHDADLAEQEGRNQPVDLPDYPAAKSHWRPDSPFLRTLLPHGPYVIAFLLSVNTPDQQALVTMAQTAYAKQIEALDKTTPLSDEEVMTLPWDPDHLLMRTLNPPQFHIPSGDGSYVLTGKVGILHYSGNLLSTDRNYIAEQLTKMDAQQVAQSEGSIGIRTAGPAAARRAVTEKLFPWRFESEAAAPQNLPDSACVENRGQDAPKRFSCVVAYNEYVGIVSSDQLLDAQQRAAAQYAIFANSR